MKRTFAIISAVLFVCFSANAQSFIENLGKRAKDKIQQKTEQKVENTVDKTIDNAFDKVEGIFKKGNGQTQENTDNKENSTEGSQTAAPTDAQAGWTCPECGKTGNTGKFCADCGAKKPGTATNAAWTCPECGKTGNTGNFCDDCGAKKPGAADGTAAPAQKKTSEMVWNNFDFVAGDEIIFEDTQENEQLGEFPSKWDLFEGNAEIAMIDGMKAINTQHGWITPLFNGKPYLTDKCTIEMDVYLYDEESYKKATGAQGVGLNDYCIYLVRRDEIVQTGNYYDCGLYVEFGCCDWFGDPEDPATKADLRINYKWHVPGTEDTAVREGSYTVNNVKFNAWHHISISFNQRAYKVYFDEQRVANIPNADAPKWLELDGSYDHEKMYFWKNIRIAKGAVPLYDRLKSEGKIITYGITFDTGKATIKNESMGEINRIKDIMNQDTGIRFEIQGHCDNTGSAEVNDKLSQQRADAIVAKLVELGISKDRLTAVGKGSHSPIADNSTDEGRAKNRRVEFIKK